MIYLRTRLSSLFKHFVTVLVQMPALPTWRQLGYSRGNTKRSKASFWMNSWKLFKSNTSFLQNKWNFFDDTHVRPRHGELIKILTGVSTKLVKASSGKDPESEICGQKEETTQVFCQYLFRESALKIFWKITVCEISSFFGQEIDNLVIDSLIQKTDFLEFKMLLGSTV